MFQLKDDPKFEEFLDAHLKGGKKQIWNNDASVTMATPKKEESDSDSDEDEDEDDSGVEGTGILIMKKEQTKNY